MPPSRRGHGGYVQGSFPGAGAPPTRRAPRERPGPWPPRRPPPGRGAPV